ncbi:MAG: glycoside hydrolase family 88 protein [Clostridia bacterium]|nr:glycoside hydrolase family 88 protein [Clostridia bacterium]
MKDKNLLKPIDISRALCDTVINTYEPEKLPGPEGRFDYIQGVFLLGMQRINNICRETRYFDYIKAWADSMISDDGVIKCQNDWLDDMMPAVLLFDLYKETGMEKYKTALESTVGRFKTWKRNKYGGFYHMFKTKDQMWLDGLFMGGLLLSRYAEECGAPEYLDEVYHQTKLMHDYMRDEKTGLYYHAWDASCEQPWADPETGLSSEFWGRAQGWVTVAICDMLDYFPENHPRRQEMIDILADLLSALARYQNKDTGLWYQVVDKGQLEDNWCETSCSSLFAYSFHKAVRMGYIGRKFAEVSERAYRGVLGKTDINDDGSIVIHDISVGTCVMDYKGYVERPRVDNDNHGTGTFLLMCSEYSLGD